MGQFDAAQGAFLLYLGNYASVMMAAMIVFYAVGHRTAPGPAIRAMVAHPIRLFQFVLFVLLVVSFGFRFAARVEERTRMLAIEHALEENLAAMPGARLVELRIQPSVAPDSIIATVRAPNPITPTEVSGLQAAIPEEERGGLTLRVRTIPVVVAEPSGYLFTDPLP